MRFLLPLVLFACAEPAKPDLDGDGFAAPADCDDADDAVHPDAAEVCDGVDNDCSGVVDDAPTDGETWYPDRDGDGWAGDADPVVACEAPAGHRDAARDCDDADAAINPLASEECDGIDNDCDEVVDDGGTWYRDSDGDGFGNAGATVRHGCEAAPDGYVADATDCDDYAAATNPAGQEVCDDADADEDCDALADDADDSVATESMVGFYPDADADTYGDAAGAAVFACEAPAGHVPDARDCDDADPDVHPDADEGCGTDDNCDGVPDGDCRPEGDIRTTEADATLRHPGTSTRFSPASGDLDADGFDDVVLGVPMLNGSAGTAGGVWIVPGPVPADADAEDVAVAELVGIADGDFAGFSVSIVGDVDADGADDLLVGASHTDDADTWGTAYLLYGPTRSESLVDADARLLSDTAIGGAGAVTAAGDVDADGYADVLVCAPGHASLSGAAYLLYGPVRGEVALADADVRIQGTQTREELGWPCVGVGDTDGDGFDDLLLQAPDGTGGPSPGAVHLFAGGALAGDLTPDDATSSMTPGRDDLTLSNELGAAGDTNADGYDDLLVATDSSSGDGAVYVVLGPVRGDAALVDSAAALHLEADAYHPDEVAGGGDVDADGHADVVVLSGDAAADVSSTNGRGYVAYGPFAGDVELGEGTRFLPGESGHYLGYEASGAGDTDGDGYDDLIFGGRSATWLLLGGEAP